MEFALILPETPGDAASAVAEHVRSEVMDLRITHGADGAGPHVTLSVGVASHVPGETDDRPGRLPDQLLAAADQALYAAKRLGCNRIFGAGEMLTEFARHVHGAPQLSLPFQRKSGLY
jgi:diguanylate cyclase (GGDEF)-like protein